MKKNLAVIGVGIVGTGRHGEGIPAFVDALIALREEYHITVYSFIPIDKQRVPSGITMRCVHSQKVPMRIRYIILAFRFILDHLRKKYHLIHAQSPVPAGVMARIVGKIFGIPWLLSFHATEAALIPERSFGDLMNTRLAKRSRQVTQRANAIMTMSSFQANDVKKNLGSTKDIHVLHRGIDVPPLESKTISTPFNIVHISYYQPVKDHGTLLKTFALINRHVNATFTIIGDNYGEDFQRHKQHFAPDVDVQVRGALPRVSVQEALKNAHVLLHTSFYEGLPMVALEAMAYGTVACGTRVGCFIDFPQDCCITAEVGDYETLSKQIVLMAGDDVKFQQMRNAAHSWINQHDMNWYLSRLKSIYNRLM